MERTMWSLMKDAVKVFFQYTVSLEQMISLLPQGVL